MATAITDGHECPFCSQKRPTLSRLLIHFDSAHRVEAGVAHLCDEIDRKIAENTILMQYASAR